ncbi:hypothetical protein N752_01675 [Desulforamulus aquiferis]|nr:lytic transglycosylase domain-containing protein [Desulforamulus aquiferis]RYD06862.1 hypothetical protein N752_01675 [Desulforamulus aquiferis]
MAFRSKKSRGLKRKVIFLLLLALLFVSHKDIGRWLYPFEHQEVIYYYAEVNHLDPLLVASIIKTESNFNPNAISPKGARGLMQIMPNTGEWIYQQISGGSLNQDKLFDAETNIALGTWYLADLSAEFKGDLVLVIASYNAGRGNVKNWLTTQHWTGEHKTIDQIPFMETRQYIRKVLWNQKVYNYLYQGQ